MKLIGMLDSPYVRRVAISLQLLELPFAHEPLSVFRTYDQFRRINPVVKAPSLICDDGTVLIDSTLILAFAEALATPRSLMPAALPALQRELRLIGLALAACEKAIQIVYEHKLRPAEKLHQPWLDRVAAQLHAAWDLLERELTQQPLAVPVAAIGQAGITTAVAWQFTRQMVPDHAPEERYPTLADYSAQAEQLAQFRAAPHGLGTVQNA